VSISSLEERNGLTALLAAVYGHLGQHQPLDTNGQPIMDDPGLIFFEQVGSTLLKLMQH
jgi:hypothetical protein